jgi:predicted component of type VI protein secretion system
VVQDVYRLRTSSEKEPFAVRVTAYYVDEDGRFVNGDWLTLYLDENES